MEWFDFLLKKIPFAGNLSLTIVSTLFLFLLAFLLLKPVNYLSRLVLNKVFGKNDFFKQYIICQIQRPVGLISASILWLLILYFMPMMWKSMGGVPLFLSKSLIKGVQILIKLTIGSSLVWMSYNLVDTASQLIINRFFKLEKSNKSFVNHFLPFINKFIKILVVCLGALLILQNMGINVVSLMAGLGLGGVALALAAKDSAGNIISYVNIMLDRPFQVGDWICVNDIEGTVIDIGIRSSKIKTFYDSIIAVPNTLLTENTIDNMGKRKARRTRAYLGVQYDTEPEKLEQFIEEIKKILMKSSFIKKDYFQVYFTELGASELKIIINFFLLVNSWEMELQEKQIIFLAILKAAKELGVEFAFPTQTIHIDSMPDSFKEKYLNDYKKRQTIK